MSKSRFVLDKFVRLIEQGLLSYKDLSDEVINNFDPVAFQVFSIEIRWYSLAYIVGLLLGWMYCNKILIKNEDIKIGVTREQNEAQPYTIYRKWA